MDRQVLGVLKTTLQHDLGWNEIDYSNLVFAFQTAYAVGMVVVGRVIDRLGTRLGYALSMVFWSLASMGHAIGSSFTSFLIARSALGFGESGIFPASIKTVAEWFPNKERALATGIFNAGTSIGVVLALIIAPWILVNYGWQQVFWITGALGFLWLIFWVLLYEIPSKQKRLTTLELEYIRSGQVASSNTTTTSAGSWYQLFSLRQTWAYVTGKFLIDPIFWFFLFWLPSYFSSTFNLDLRKPSLPLMIIYASTTVGSIAGGYFSSWLIKKGWPTLKARKTALFIFAVAELSILSLPFVADVWVAVALLSLAVAIHQAWATNIFTTASDMFPKETVSSVVGIGGMAGALGGILFPMLVGYLLDAYKVEGNLAGGYNILFTLCGCAYLVAWTIIHLLTRNIDKR